jgi:hypothetical protein
LDRYVFFMTAKKINGDEYEPETLKTIKTWTLSRTKSSHSREVLGSKRKLLRQHGKGNRAKQADPLTKDWLFTVLRPAQKFVTISGEGLQNLGLCSALRACHTYCDTGPRFFRSHPKDRPNQSPLTTHEGSGLWRIYSNPDPHGYWNPLWEKPFGNRQGVC